MINKEKDSNSTRIKNNTEPLIEKDEKVEPLKQEEILEQPIQENNSHVVPTSSRQNVEVDKIYNLLRSSNNATREKQQRKSNENRIEEIVNETSKKIQNEEKPINDEVQDKINYNKLKNGFLNIALLVTLIIIAYLVYDKKNKIEPTFNDLPSNIQESYVLKKQASLLLEKLKELESQNSLLKKQIDTEKKITINTNNKDYSGIINREIFPAEKSDSKDYKIVKCYDVEAGSFFLTPTCKKDITKFLNENKNAKRFEIIGVVDREDFITLTGQTQIKTDLQKYLNMGLARYRVLETSWIITDILGKDIVLSPVNYTITSKKNNRGSIIRAYK